MNTNLILKKSHGAFLYAIFQCIAGVSLTLFLGWILWLYAPWAPVRHGIFCLAEGLIFVAHFLKPIEVLGFTFISEIGKIIRWAVIWPIYSLDSFIFIMGTLILIFSYLIWKSLKQGVSKKWLRILFYLFTFVCSYIIVSMIIFFIATFDQSKFNYENGGDVYHQYVEVKEAMKKTNHFSEEIQIANQQLAFYGYKSDSGWVLNPKISIVIVDRQHRIAAFRADLNIGTCRKSYQNNVTFFPHAVNGKIIDNASDLKTACSNLFKNKVILYNRQGTL